MRFSLFLILIGFAVPATAQVAYVHGPKGCDFIDEWVGEEETAFPIFTIDEVHTVVMPDSLQAIEWFCGFEPRFDPYMETGEIQVRPGYCNEPGFIYPGVFTLMEMGDQVQMNGSNWGDDPLILELCLPPRGP